MTREQDVVYADTSANAYLSYSRAFIHPAAWHHTPRRERLVPSDVPGNFRRLASLGTEAATTSPLSCDTAPTERGSGTR